MEIKQSGVLFFIILLFLTLFLSLVRLLGSVSFFKLFFPRPFESFQFFLNPEPRPLFVMRFLFLPHYRCYVFFHNCLASCSFLPSSFLGLVAHPGFVLFLEVKNAEARREVLHKIKSRVSIVVFLNGSELLHHTLKLTL